MNLKVLALLVSLCLLKQVLAEEPAAAPAGIPEQNSLTNSIGMKLTRIPPGDFMMGARRSDNSHPSLPHRVKIVKAFYLGTCEVTVGQFMTFEKATNYGVRWNSQGRVGTMLLLTPQGKYKSEASAQATPLDWGHPDQTDDHPVVNISWYDATAFCEWLSTKEGAHYRLPTEAEWEYACRAGTTTSFCNGEDKERLVEVANVCDDSCRKLYEHPSYNSVKATDGFAFSAPVGSFKPNAFGLFDMHGNAREWCNDWYEDDYYKRSPAADPEGPTTGEFRVLRGGSWHDSFRCMNSADRSGFQPSQRGKEMGFRVVREEKQDSSANTGAEEKLR